MKENQYNLVQTIIEKTDINITTCGHCGYVVLHSLELEEITCPHCGFTSEPCDFPDLFHSTWDAPENKNMQLKLTH